MNNNMQKISEDEILLKETVEKMFQMSPLNPETVNRSLIIDVMISYSKMLSTNQVIFMTMRNHWIKTYVKNTHVH